MTMTRMITTNMAMIKPNINSSMYLIFAAFSHLRQAMQQRGFLLWGVTLLSANKGVLYGVYFYAVVHCASGKSDRHATAFRVLMKLRWWISKGWVRCGVRRAILQRITRRAVLERGD